MTLRAVLSGALAPGKISNGKLISGEGSDLEQFKDLDGGSVKLPHPRKGKLGHPPGAGGGARWQVPGGRALASGAQPEETTST